MAVFTVKVYGHLYAVVVGGTLPEPVGIAVACDVSTSLCHEVGKLSADGLNAPAEICKRGTFYLECYGGLLYVRGIDAEQCLSIVGRCVS